MGRLIDGDVLMELLTTAIMNMKGMAKFLDLEDDPEIKMEIKAYTDIANGVKDMPTIEPEPKWIPCSERLPDEYGNYLISIKGEEPDIGTINPNDPRGWSLCDANGFYWANDKMLNIIAWMPLPEPYREEGEE